MPGVNVNQSCRFRDVQLKLDELLDLEVHRNSYVVKVSTVKYRSVIREEISTIETGYPPKFLPGWLVHLRKNLMNSQLQVPLVDPG